MDKKLHVEGHRVNWMDHSDAIVVGPILERKVSNIRDVLLDMNNGKLSMFSCLQVIAMEVFTQAEIAEQAAAEQLHQADDTCILCGYDRGRHLSTCANWR